MRAIAIPVTAQSVVMSLLLVTDQLMVGQLGTTAVAAVGISFKLTAVLTVALTGLATGVSIFAARHWGSGDRSRIRHLLGLGLLLGFAFASAITFLVAVFPEAAMSPFTTDTQVLAEGAGFIRVIAIGYIPTMLTLLYSAVLRSTGSARLPMWASIAVILLGVYVSRHVVAVTRVADLRGADAKMLRRFALVALHLAFNELLGYWEGQLIGGGVVAALGIGLLLAAGTSAYVGLYATSGHVRHMGQLCLLVFAGFLWVRVANMILAGSVLNAGGDSRYVLIMESLATWVVGVPTAYIAACVFDFPVWAVFLLLSLEEVVRLGAGWARLRSGRWQRNLTAVIPEPELT